MTHVEEDGVSSRTEPPTVSGSQRPRHGRALVLGGGGLAGIAWELGVLAGLERAGVRLRDADLVIGTSAGAAVGATLRAATDLEAAVQRQLDGDVDEIAPQTDPEVLWARFRDAISGASGDVDLRRRFGQLALATATVTEQQRLRIIAGRLTYQEWPDHPRLLITAVDAMTGDFVTFDRDSGVSLVDAVAASCAVPGVWPPVTIGGRRYIDGGVRSATNVDLAEGAERVVVMAPLQADAPGVRTKDALEPFQDRTSTIVPDRPSIEAMGVNVLDPSVRPAVARAGLRQGALEADRVGAYWG